MYSVIKTCDVCYTIFYKQTVDILKIDSSFDRKPRLKTDSVPLFTRSKRDKPRTTRRHGNSSCSTIPGPVTSCLACYGYEQIIFLCRPVVLGLSGLPA